MDGMFCSYVHKVKNKYLDHQNTKVTGLRTNDISMSILNILVMI